MPHFTTEVAPQLIFDNPGLTHTEIAAMALNMDLAASNAEDKLGSLSSSLAKQVREDVLPEVYRERIDGTFRYYPKATSRVGIDLQFHFMVRDTGEHLVYAKQSGKGNGFSEAILTVLESLMNSHILDDPQKWQIRKDVEHLLGVLRPRVESRKLG